MRPLAGWLRWLFALAQRRVERQNFKARVWLMEHDTWMDDVKKTLGVPEWG